MPDSPLPRLTPEEFHHIQTEGLLGTLGRAFAGSPAYRAKFDAAGVKPADVRSLDDLGKLPFTTVDDLRDGYPLPLLSVPEEDVIRIHASSGTTGKRKVLAYTQKDVDDWGDMFARCYALAGLTRRDRVQIAVGYGLWTAGVGFQLGCERFGAMAVPMGPGNIDLQIDMLVDMGVTCLCSTASMALLLAEEVERRGIKSHLKLHTCIFGAEPHTPKMRAIFEERLGVRESFDVTGLTELYGPGAGLECRAHHGVHYWADYYILEILDPETLKPVAPGEVGEMVVTTLRKEAVPLIRYRTRDLTRLLPGDCSCGVCFPRHDKILGRSDDMFVFRGVNIYPGQIAAVIEHFPELASEYHIRLSRSEGHDAMHIRVERAPEAATVDEAGLVKGFGKALHKALMARAEIELLQPGALPRTFGKTKRVTDERE